MTIQYRYTMYDDQIMVLTSPSYKFFKTLLASNDYMYLWVQCDISIHADSTY